MIAPRAEKLPQIEKPQVWENAMPISAPILKRRLNMARGISACLSKRRPRRSHLWRLVNRQWLAGIVASR